MITLSYTLWSYDVWGNAEDGYDVNNRSAYCRDLEIETPIGFASNGQILDALIGCGYFRQDVTLMKIEITDDTGTYIDIVDVKDARPICGLELNE